MRIDYQQRLFELIKSKISGNDSLGHVLSEVLSISQDAVYRRTRGETQLTIFELEKLSKHFGISMDGLFGIEENAVTFNFKSIKDYEYSMDDYLANILSDLQLVKSQKEVSLIMTVNNTPLFQLLNFPHLIRFKLFFWAKTHLQIPEYKDTKFGYAKISDKTFNIGKDILRVYNSIPSQEIYDPSLLRGFTREIYYYFNANMFEDPEYALYLLTLIERFIAHLKDQAAHGKKFIANTAPPANGNDFKMYYNETLNANGSIYYKTAESEGLYLTHNIMNFLSTRDEKYISDSVAILHKQMANSSIISEANEKERNKYFFQIENMVNQYRKKMELELTM